MLSYPSFIPLVAYVSGVVVGALHSGSVPLHLSLLQVWVLFCGSGGKGVCDYILL